MIYVGIDVASEKHDCCILDGEKKEIKSFSFSNTAQGFALFLREILQETTANEIRIGLEATGIYGDNLVAFLRQNGLEVCSFNPLIVKNRHSGTTLRKTKTDVTDAKFIAYLVAGEDFQPTPATV